MKKVLLLSLVPFFVFAMNLSDFTGKYTLVSAEGDKGQFVDECPQILEVNYIAEDNSLSTDYKQFTGGYKTFKHINGTRFSEPGEKGRWVTYTDENSVITDYIAFKIAIPPVSRLQRTITLDNTMLIYSEHDYGEDNIALECIYDIVVE